MTVICSWCKRVLFQGTSDVTHTCCEICTALHFPE